MTPPFFTEAEAKGKLEQRVQVMVHFLGVPQGACGTVINFEPYGGGFIVKVTWDDGRGYKLFTPLMYKLYLREVDDGQEAA